jgi:hypothetical protein
LISTTLEWQMCRDQKGDRSAGYQSGLSALWGSGRAEGGLPCGLKRQHTGTRLQAGHLFRKVE